jgi:uncharacterized membrane protein YoaK (UPF0700 family)
VARATDSSSPPVASAAGGVVTEAARTLRPPAGDRHGPLPPLLLALTVVTGVVDAVSFLKLGHVFVANMTGNVVFLGFGIAGAPGISATIALAAIAAFLVGALAGGRLVAVTPGHRGRMLRTSGAVQALLLALALVLAATGPDSPSGAARYALIVPLGLAMGVQNAAAQRLAVPELTTTVLTRTLTGLVSEAKLARGPGAQAGRRLLAVVAMLAGAIAGALLALDVSIAAALLLATAIVTAVAAAIHVLSRSPAPWVQAKG